MKKIFPKTLVLGSTGMVGRTIFDYLANKYPLMILGSSRTPQKKSNIFLFETKDTFERLKLKTLKVKYIVNCIGILNGSKNPEEMKIVNSKFPHKLEKFCKQKKIKLIHVSTDAVFDDNSKINFEDSTTNPSDYYGKTKLKGEINKGINIRSSFIGFDPLEKKGLLELVLKSKDEEIIGFTNQIWTGCTTLQFAIFIEDLIGKNLYDKFVENTNIIHFAPLGPVSKYKILKTFSEIVRRGKLTKGKGVKRTRILKSKIIEEKLLKRYNNDLNNALNKLIKFYPNYEIKY